MRALEIIDEVLYDRNESRQGLIHHSRDSLQGQSIAFVCPGVGAHIERNNYPSVRWRFALERRTEARHPHTSLMITKLLRLD